MNRIVCLALLVSTACQSEPLDLVVVQASLPVRAKTTGEAPPVLTLEHGRRLVGAAPMFWEPADVLRVLRADDVLYASRAGVATFPLSQLRRTVRADSVRRLSAPRGTARILGRYRKGDEVAVWAASEAEATAAGLDAFFVVVDEGRPAGFVPRTGFEAAPPPKSASVSPGVWSPAPAVDVALEPWEQAFDAQSLTALGASPIVGPIVGPTAGSTVAANEGSTLTARFFAHALFGCRGETGRAEWVEADDLGVAPDARAEASFAVAEARARDLDLPAHACLGLSIERACPPVPPPASSNAAVDPAAEAAFEVEEAKHHARERALRGREAVLRAAFPQDALGRVDVHGPVPEGAVMVVYTYTPRVDISACSGPRRTKTDVSLRALRLPVLGPAQRIVLSVERGLGQRVGAYLSVDLSSARARAAAIFGDAPVDVPVAPATEAGPMPPLCDAAIECRHE